MGCSKMAVSTWIESYYRFGRLVCRSMDENSCGVAHKHHRVVCQSDPRPARLGIGWMKCGAFYGYLHCSARIVPLCRSPLRGIRRLIHLDPQVYLFMESRHIWHLCMDGSA